MKSTLSSNGRIILPAALRKQDDLKPGQELEIERLHRGEYRLVATAAPKNQGLVDWLRRCPEKGYFVAIESGSTSAKVIDLVD
jgi:AbrB family looped-hinge helix DNA binding protein